MGIKISDISSELLQLPQNSRWDKKYIDGLIKEQLAVLDYKKTFPQGLNEQDEDKDEDDVELEPETIPVPDEEPENIEISDDELIPKGDEEEITVEPESEPEVTPETIPVPDEPISPEIEKKQAEYTTISKEQARELLSFKGKIFQAVFTKKTDGTIRAMNGMTGVRKYTSGGELPYSPKDKGLVPVYDLKIGNAAMGYRMLNLDGLKTLHMNKKKYKIDPFLKEIKVNNPNKTWDDVWDLISGLHKQLGRNYMLKQQMEIAKHLGWEENGVNITTYFKLNPNLISKYYSELYKLKNNIQENMKRSELKEIIKEVVRSTQPQRVAPERETITKPETDTPERKPKRRTLTPPTEAPNTKPKAEGVIKENEQDIAQKIASRFQKLNKTVNEISLPPTYGSPSRGRNHGINDIMRMDSQYKKENLDKLSDKQLHKIWTDLMIKNKKDE